MFKGIFDGINAARKGKLPKKHYENLTYTPFLYDPQDLFHLYNHADDEQKMMIHDYLTGEFDGMTRNVSKVGRYAALCTMIEKDLNRGKTVRQQDDFSVPTSHMDKNVVYLDDFRGDW